MMLQVLPQISASSSSSSSSSSSPPPAADISSPTHTFPRLSVSSGLWNVPPLLASDRSSSSSSSSSCSAESLALDQQVFLRDATSEGPCLIENLDSSRHYGNQTFEAQMVPSYLSAKEAKEAFLYKKKWKKGSILCSLENAAEYGHTLAGELLHAVKDSLYATVSHNLRAKMSQDWVSILSLSILEQYIVNDCIHNIPAWLLQPSCFARVIEKVSQIRIWEDSQHSCVEDLLLTISRFERTGLVVELKRLGFKEVACILGGRDVFYGVFARMGALREASKLLCYLRLAMKIPMYDTWSVVFNNDPHKKCLNHIRSICMFPERYKNFAWKLDKVELCAKEIKCVKKPEAQNAHAVSMGIRKLFESPMGAELRRIRALSTLDTAMRLIQHYSEIFESLEAHGFSEK